MAAEQHQQYQKKKYVVLKNFVGNYTRGDVVSAQELGWDGGEAEAYPAELKAHIEALEAEGVIREASEWEGKLGGIPAEYVTKNAHKNAPKELAVVGLAPATATAAKAKPVAPAESVAVLTPTPATPSPTVTTPKPTPTVPTPEEGQS